MCFCFCLFMVFLKLHGLKHQPANHVVSTANDVSGHASRIVLGLMGFSILLYSHHDLVLHDQTLKTDQNIQQIALFTEAHASSSVRLLGTVQC